MNTFNIDTIIAASVADEHDAIATNAGENAFASLRDHALNYGYSSKEDFEASLEGTEVDYMETFHPTEKFKTGKWKMSKLPMRYRTAKSVVGSAVGAGIIFGNLGKTEAEKALKEAKKQDKSEAQKFSEMLENCKKQWRKVDDANEVSSFSETVVNFFDNV